MSKKEKLILKILSNSKSILPSEARKFLESLGYIATGPRGGSSHLTYRKRNKPSVTIVLTQNPLKSYIVEKLKEVIKEEL